MNPKLRNDSSVNVKNGNVTAEQGSTVTYAPETNIFQNKKVVIGTVVAVVALLIIGFLVFRGFSLDGRLVGTWSGNDAAMSDRYHYAGDIIFKSDHTFVMMNHDEVEASGTWKTNSSKNLILTANGYSQTLVWNDNVNWTSESASWNLSGDVMYIGTTRYDRQ